MEISDKYACQMHGITSSDSETDLENSKDFDEEYNSLKPPPLEYESIKDKIVVISRCEEKNNEQETSSEMTLVTNKKKKKSKQNKVNGNRIKANENEENIVTVDNPSSKMSKSAGPVSQAKKNTKITLQNQTSNSSSLKCVSVQNLKASKVHSQNQTNKASNPSKKKKLKNSAPENKLKNTKQSKNQNSSSIKNDSVSQLKNKNEAADSRANKNTSEKKSKKNNPQNPVHVAISQNKRPSPNILSDTPKSTQENGLISSEIYNAISALRKLEQKIHEMMKIWHSDLSLELNIQRDIENHLFTMRQIILNLGSARYFYDTGTQLLDKLNQTRSKKITGNFETEKELPPTQKLINEKQSAPQNDSGMMQSTSKINDAVPNTENPGTFDTVEKNTSLTDMSTKKKAKSKKSKQKTEVNFAGEKSSDEIVDANPSVTSKQTLNCTKGFQEPDYHAPESEDEMMPVLVIKYKNDNKKHVKRTRRDVQNLIDQDLVGELEKNVTKRLGIKETFEKLSEPDHNYVIICNPEHMKRKKGNTKQNCVVPENEIVNTTEVPETKTGGKKKKNKTLKPVLVKQSQIDMPDLVNLDSIGNHEKTIESVTDAESEHKQHSKAVLEGQQPQTLNNQEDLEDVQLLEKEIIERDCKEPENENLITKEVSVTNIEGQNEKTVKPVLIKQLQINTLHLASDDSNRNLEKTTETVKDTELEHKQISKILLEERKPQTLKVQELGNEKTVKPVLLKQSQIDTVDLVSQDTISDREEAIEGLTFWKYLVFRVEIQENQALEGIKRACQTHFTTARILDNLNRPLLKQLKTIILDLAGQNSNAETIGVMPDKQFWKRQEKCENYLSLNNVQQTLIVEVHANSSTKKTKAISFKYYKDTGNKTPRNKRIICLKDFRESFKASRRSLKYTAGCDVIMKLTSRQYGPIYRLIYECTINRQTLPENRNMLMSSPCVETAAFWPSLQTSNLKSTFHEEKNIPTPSSDIEVNCKLFGNEDYRSTACVVQIIDETDSASCLGASVSDEISGLKDQKVGNSGTARILTDSDDNINYAHDGNILMDNRKWGHSTDFVSDASREEKKQLVRDVPTEDSPNVVAEQESVYPELDTDSLRSRLCHVTLVITLAYLVVSFIANIALLLLYNVFSLSVILVLYFYMKR